ncbi:hypothetical protein BD770DRAFT_403543 [Pilaira anomala]|nr:hypothetical protein BD770DRAFT_403543 [Pilaira anomala]
MSVSPSRENASPLRASNRYAERYKSYLIDSPPREGTKKSTDKLNSPLNTTNNETKIFESERYSAYELKNEDRGEWRQSTSNTSREVDETEIPKPSASPKPEKQQKSLPRYMQSTSSYVGKVHSAKDQRNALGPRSRGGITKRVGVSKIPKYKATTNINAIEDIKSEMGSEDTYVTMAARIKLFEKGLGNGSNKRGHVVPHQSPSSSTTTSSQSNKSHNSGTRQDVTTHDNRNKTSKTAITTTNPTKSSSRITKPSTPNYLRKTVSSETKSHQKKISNDFKEKLNMWRGKINMHNKETKKG